MRKLIAMTITVFILSSGIAFSDNVGGRGNFGLGLAVGDPSGLSAKYMFSGKTGFSTTVGWKTSGDTEINASFDLLFHKYNSVKIRGTVSPVYGGTGLRLKNRGNEEGVDELAIRIPIGIELFFRELSVGAFAELVPTLKVKPDTKTTLQLAFGIRYFF